MSEKSIDLKVKDIIVEQLSVNAEQVTPKPSLSKTWVPTPSTSSNSSWHLKKNLASKFPTAMRKNS